MRPETVTPVPTPLATTEPAQRRGSAYAQLSRRIREAGLLDRRRRYYAWKIAVTLTVWVGGWVAFVVTGDSWWTLAYAVLFAALFTQFGFLGHDAGHRQIFREAWKNDVVGLIFGNRSQPTIVAPE